MVMSRRHATGETLVTVGPVREVADPRVLDQIAGVEVFVGSLPWVLVALLAVTPVALVELKALILYDLTLKGGDESIRVLVVLEYWWY